MKVKDKQQYHFRVRWWRAEGGKTHATYCKYTWLNCMCIVAYASPLPPRSSFFLKTNQKWALFTSFTCLHSVDMLSCWCSVKRISKETSSITFQEARANFWIHRPFILHIQSVSHHPHLRSDHVTKSQPGEPWRCGHGVGNWENQSWALSYHLRWLKNYSNLSISDNRRCKRWWNLGICVRSGGRNMADQSN